MALSDTITALGNSIVNLINSKEAVYFTNVADLKAATRLSAGQIVCTKGYYTANDGGQARYLIRATAEGDVDDGGSILTLTAEGLVAELIVENGIVNVKQFGAKGDGTTDDTTKIQAAINFGQSVLLPESTYYITDTIFIDTSKTTFFGQSSKSVIMANAPENKPSLHLYCSNSDYYKRKDKERKYYNFTINRYGNNRPDGLGLELAGNDGTIYEGSFECCIFENIRISGFNKGVILNSHIYNCLFTNIDVNECFYSLYSQSWNDTGEVTTFLKCSFWSGCMYLRHRETKFIACTIHFGFDTNYQQALTLHDEEVKCVHYFGYDTVTQFIGCHLESLAANITTDYVFYVDDALLTFSSCDGCIADSQDYFYTCKNFFKIYCILTSGVVRGVNIKSSNFKFIFSRCDAINGFISGPAKYEDLNIGNDYARGTGSFMYEKSPIFRITEDLSPSSKTWVSFRDNVGELNTQITEQYSESTDTSIITCKYQGTRDGNIIFNIYHEVDVAPYSTLLISGNIYSVNNVRQSDEETAYGIPYITWSTDLSLTNAITLYDINGKLINWESDNLNAHYYINVSPSSSPRVVQGRLRFPPEAVRCCFGLGGWIHIYGIEPGDIDAQLSIEHDMKYEFV